LFGVLLLTVPLGCDDKPSRTAGTRPAHAPEVVAVEGEDEGIAAAVETARASLPEFVAVLRAPKPGQAAFTIKVEFRDGDRTEYMNLTPVTFDGKLFHGTLDNDPVAVRNVKRGDAAAVGPERVADWSYVEDGRLIGGYTLRVLRDRMSPEQRRQFDQGRGFRME
jgi:uncharacterized protein YegJ (DUF2314 family)